MSHQINLTTVSNNSHQLQSNQRVVLVNRKWAILTLEPTGVITINYLESSDKPRQRDIAEYIWIGCFCLVSFVILSLLIKWLATPKILSPYTNTVCQPGHSFLWGLWKEEEVCNTNTGYDEK